MEKLAKLGWQKLIVIAAAVDVVLGIVFGAVAIGKHMGGKGMAIGGLVCSIVALVLEFLVLLVGIGILAMIFSAMSF